MIALLAAVSVTGGCVSRQMVLLEPPEQPALERLEEHLDYTDPDEGRPDYIITR